MVKIFNRVLLYCGYNLKPFGVQVTVIILWVK